MGVILLVTPLKIPKVFVRKREESGRKGNAAEGLFRNPASRAVPRCHRRPSNSSEGPDR